MTRTATHLTTCLLATISLPALADDAGFFEGASASLDTRNFYFNRDFRQAGASQSRQEEWAQGFMLKAQSGYTPGPVGFGLDLVGMLGVKLDSGAGRANSGLLPTHDDGHGADEFSRLGAVAKVRLSQTELKVGELFPELPILLRNDARLLPQSYQGGMLTSREIDGLTLHGGQFRSASQRNSTDDADLAAEGLSGFTSDRFNYAGAEYRFNAERTLVGIWQSQLKDIYRQRYYNLTHKQQFGDWTLTANLGLFTGEEDGSAQAGDLDNRSLTSLLSIAHGGHTLHAGYQRMYGDDGALLLSGASTPLVNDIQVRNFILAGERSWQLRYDYNFAAAGIPGLTAFARYVRGSDVELSGATTGHEWERNLDVTYTVQSGPLKNLALRWRNAMVRSSFGADIDENRLIIAYTLPLK
ncbi:OprD family porin [Pseudomonas sp. LRF_L74]|uniref:OprD family porin n=1 Tax=Pseudomonas sp. LRF_L74 TaxID=3369422 RepID=UPI003F630DB8